MVCPSRYRAAPTPCSSSRSRAVDASFGVRPGRGDGPATVNGLQAQVADGGDTYQRARRHLPGARRECHAHLSGFRRHRAADPPFVPCGGAGGEGAHTADRCRRRARRVARRVPRTSTARAADPAAQRCRPSPGASTPAPRPASRRGQMAGTSVPTRVGVYIGGANQGCAQPNLTTGWVSVTAAQGWGILPLWVGPQAPCTTLGKTTKISPNPGVANAEGQAEASAAANAADAASASDGSRRSTTTWRRTHARRLCTARSRTSSTGGSRPECSWLPRGFYSEPLLRDPRRGARRPGNASLTPLNAIWIAAWNDTPNIFGFGAPCALSDSLWINHQRVHQYIGGHDESHGGVTINIDSNAVDGPTVP